MDVILPTILLALIAFRFASTKQCYFEHHNKESTLEECSAGCCLRGVGLYPCCREEDPRDSDDKDDSNIIALIVAPSVTCTVIFLILLFVIPCIIRRQRRKNQAQGIIYNARYNPHGVSIGDTYVPPAGYTTVVHDPSGDMAMGVQQGQPPIVYHQHPTICHQYSTVHNQNPTVHGQHRTVPLAVPEEQPTAHGQHPTVHGQQFYSYDKQPPSYADIIK